MPNPITHHSNIVKAIVEHGEFRKSKFNTEGHYIFSCKLSDGIVLPRMFTINAEKTLFEIDGDEYRHGNHKQSSLLLTITRRIIWADEIREIYPPIRPTP